jgi:hypothetical protein
MTQAQPVSSGTFLLPSAAASGPPSSGEPSYPARAFGRAAARYYSFLQALIDGLLEYEAWKGGGHAPEPLSAA